MLQSIKRRELIRTGTGLLPLFLLPGRSLLAQETEPAVCPTGEAGYPGSEESAPWREEALARIERYRKGNFSLRFQDHDGQPIRNVRVRGELYRHHFGFGAAVEPARVYSLAPEQAGQFLERKETFRQRKCNCKPATRAIFLSRYSVIPKWSG